MKSKIIIPAIKSQGIKTKLVPWILDLVKIADSNGTWIEPFLGTGVVALNCGYEKAILNDINPHIINFYREIQLGQITPHSMKLYLLNEGEILRNANNEGYEHYLEVRKRFNSGQHSPYDFIFLSRAGFNGMMRFNKNGQWNIPFCKKPDRFAKAYVTKIVNQIIETTKIVKTEPHWQFTNKSFKEIIPLAKEGDIIYCDPPYFGRNVDYFNSWTENDEEELFNLLSETKAKFILSTWHHSDWRENEMIEKYWNKFNIVTKDHFYHNGGKVTNRKSVVEALVCNFSIDDIQLHNHINLDLNQLNLDI